MKTFLYYFDKFLTVVTVVVGILLLLKLFVFQQVNVVGQSMQPNFMDGEKLVLNKIETEVKRGQVVSVYETPSMADGANFFTKTFPSLAGKPIKFLLKRVIAVPGDEIEIVGSRVIIYNSQHPDGNILDENYITNGIKEEMEKGCASYGRYYPKTKVENGKYFIMGDNRCNSLDSRDTKHGQFSKDLLLGGVVYRYWPTTAFGSVALGEYSFRAIDPQTKKDLIDAKNAYLTIR